MKIFTHVFHENHLVDLMTALKDHQFYILNTFYKQMHQPLPDNAQMVSHVIDCDVYIFNMDHQIFGDTNKARMVRELSETVPKDKRRIWIVNSIPVNNGIDEELKQKMLDFIGDDEMVVNSHESAKIYGKGTPIHHGIEGYKPQHKEPRVITYVSPLSEAYEYYNHDFLQEVRDILKTKYGINHIWLSVDTNFKDKNDYKDYLERSLVYFHPCIHSPMPRTRTEAMLAGCCIVTTPHHDADTFISDGNSGFIVDQDPEAVALLISKLLTDQYKLAKTIGENGRKVAQTRFNYNNYRKKWEKTLRKYQGT